MDVALAMQFEVASLSARQFKNGLFFGSGIQSSQSTRLASSLGSI
jgi:hypothetical protein